MQSYSKFLNKTTLIWRAAPIKTMGLNWVLKTGQGFKPDVSSGGRAHRYRCALAGMQLEASLSGTASSG